MKIFSLLLLFCSWSSFSEDGVSVVVVVVVVVATPVAAAAAAK